MDRPSAVPPSSPRPSRPPRPPRPPGLEAPSWLVVAIIILGLAAPLLAVAWRIKVHLVDYRREAARYNETQFQQEGLDLARHAAEVGLAYIQAGEAVKVYSPKHLQVFKQAPEVFGVLFERNARVEEKIVRQPFLTAKIDLGLRLLEQDQAEWKDLGPSTLILNDGRVLEGQVLRQGPQRLNFQPAGTSSEMLIPLDELAFRPFRTRMYRAREEKPGGRRLRAFTRPIYSPRAQRYGVLGWVTVFLFEQDPRVPPLPTPPSTALPSPTGP